MPFNRPSPQDILKRIQAEMDLLLPGSDARLPFTPEQILARIQAIASHELHGHISWLARQILVDSADVEYLDRHAQLWGIVRHPAVAATGGVTFTGDDSEAVPAGTTLTRGDGVLYTLDDEVTIAGTTGSGTVTAVEGGAAGNAEAATKLRLTTPVSGISSNVSVDGSGLTGGADAEDDDALRARVTQRMQEPPHGGAAYDYIAWAQEISGVTRVWVYPEQTGPGTVTVIFVMDDKEGTIIPDAGEVAAVQDHIDSVRPVTADVTVLAPTPVPVDFDITLDPNTAAVQAAVTAELEDFFSRESVPGGTLKLSRIGEAISAGTGEYSHVLTDPVADVVMSFGDIATLGTITYAGA